MRKLPDEHSLWFVFMVGVTLSSFAKTMPICLAMTYMYFQYHIEYMFEILLQTLIDFTFVQKTFSSSKYCFKSRV